MDVSNVSTDDIRSPRFNATAGIDCEFNHPELGWIPFAAHPDDAEPMGRHIFELASQGEVETYVPPEPTNADVNAERERRILAGATFTVSGHADPIAVAGDETTQTNLVAMSIAAQARMAQGDTTTITRYRDENNDIHDLTPPQVFELWSLGSAYVSAIYQASWALKDNPAGIPADYAEDHNWPE